jgi:signal transduction histidine kinase
MNKDTICSGKTCQIITIAGVLCLILWGIDSVLDSFLFRDLNVLQHLLLPEKHKVVNYAQAAIVIIILAAYTEYLMRAHRRADKDVRNTLSVATAEKARSEGILEALGDAISIQDTSFKIIYQNRTHRFMVGEHKGEFCYKAYNRRDQVCDGCLLIRAFQDGGTYTKEKQGFALNGPVTVEITVSALRDQDGMIVAGIEAVRDISERKRIEDEIVRLNNDLMQQAEELKAANSDLETFNYSVSHDLRTPLTRICCSADALRAGYSHQMDDDGKFFLENLETGSRQMQELIEAMLDLSRVTRSELVYHELDLGLLARSVFSGMDRILPLRKVEFSASEGLWVKGDERMLRIAFTNLIENAWKFTQQRDPALISVGVEQGSGGPVYFIRDNGAGFDMAQADRLFTPFNRLHTDDDFPGTGIGLATVQRVIKRHDGRIWAESSPGHGATFFFTLPQRHDDTDAL